MDQELEIATELARRAGEMIRRVYAGSFEVVHKEHGQGPVTVADRDADALIRAGLEQAFPDDAILSEETPDDLARLSHRRLWLVDPLDGTRQFVEGIDEFAVMIGLAVEGEPVLGVVHLPTEGLTYTGCLPGGAFEVREASGERRPLRLESWGGDRSARPVVALSRFNATSRTRRVAESLNPERVVQSGSVGRKAMLVAAGRADAYVSMGRRSRHWDACAPDAIVRAAGGVFGSTDGRRLRYNTPDTRNDSGLFACRRGLETALVRAAAAMQADGDR